MFLFDSRWLNVFKNCAKFQIQKEKLKKKTKEQFLISVKIQSFKRKEGQVSLTLEENLIYFIFHNSGIPSFYYFLILNSIIYTVIFHKRVAIICWWVKSFFYCSGRNPAQQINHRTSLIISS